MGGVGGEKRGDEKSGGGRSAKFRKKRPKVAKRGGIEAPTELSNKNPYLGNLENFNYLRFHGRFISLKKRKERKREKSGMPLRRLGRP